MHSDQPYFPGNTMLPLGDQAGYYMQNAPMASVFNGGFVPPGIIKPVMPFHSVDVHPSDACPRNFIIFDQTNNKSQIMFHPEMNPRLFYPGFGVDTSIFQENVDQKDANDEIKIASSLKEDSDDIDALLSTEYEENEECDEDDDEVSTARTDAVYACNSPDSCSNYESPSTKSQSLFRKSGNEKKRQRMRKMVKALKGIVPGAKGMSTVAVLDEAVRYLKSLRVEVKKLGVRNSKG